MPLPFIMAAAAAPAVTSLWTILFGSIGISAVTTPTILVGSEYLLLSQKEKTPDSKPHPEVVSALKRAQSAGTKVVVAATAVETTAQSVSKSSASLGVATSTAEAASTKLVAALPVLTDTSVRVADAAQSLVPVLVENTRALGVTASSLASAQSDIATLRGTVAEQAATIARLEEALRVTNLASAVQSQTIAHQANTLAEVNPRMERLRQQVSFFTQLDSQEDKPTQGGLNYAS